jgi:L-cysteine:1D-myo-inositol 2-amino-2-deoxy-alpha-D-glucopyranoside ligase
MHSWPAPERPPSPRPRAPAAVARHGHGRGAGDDPRCGGPPLRLRHHPLRRHPHGARRHLRAFDLVQRVWLDAGHAGALRAERHRRRRPSARPRAGHRGRLGGAGRPGDPAVPRGHGGAARAAAPALRRRGRVDPVGHRLRREAAGGRRGVRGGRRPVLPSARRREVRVDRRSGRGGMHEVFASVAATPTVRARSTPSTACSGSSSGPASPRGTAPSGAVVPAGTSSARRSPSSTSTASVDVQGGGRDLAFPHHEMGAAEAHVATGTWPYARHYTHTGMVGLDGEKMSKSRGNLVFVSALRRRASSRPRSASLCSPTTTATTGSGRTPTSRRPRSGSPPGGRPWRRRVRRRLLRSSTSSGPGWPTTWTPPGRSRPWTGGPRRPGSGRVLLAPRTRQRATRSAQRSTPCSVSLSDPRSGVGRTRASSPT